MLGIILVPCQYYRVRMTNPSEKKTEKKELTGLEKKRARDEKTTEEKINEIIVEGANVVKMEVDYRYKQSPA